MEWEKGLFMEHCLKRRVHRIQRLFGVYRHKWNSKQRIKWTGTVFMYTGVLIVWREVSWVLTCIHDREWLISSSFFSSRALYREEYLWGWGASGRRYIRAAKIWTHYHVSCIPPLSKLALSCYSLMCPLPFHMPLLLVVVCQTCVPIFYPTIVLRLASQA